ncbi:MAG: EpsG family protein [Lentimicrobiaceae bacterium]|nr:EpsG family protein [Lentimicrobiaceae bacterium]
MIKPLPLRSAKLTIKPLPVVLLFLVWPFGLLFASLRNFKAPNAKTGFILFCLYFGGVFIVSSDIGGADSARYAQMLRDLHQQTPTLENFWSSIYGYETGLLDVYQPMITWILATVTDNVHILFAIFGLVFGWFYANNIWIILKQMQGKFSYMMAFLLLIFALINPIWNINGVRMWTAAQIFIYGVLIYFIENKTKAGVLWAIASVFVHFSFLFPLVILLGYKILPKKISVYFVLYIFTLLFSEIDIYTVQNYLLLLPEIFQPRVESYTNIQYVDKLNKSAEYYNWYVGFSKIALKIAINSLFIVVIFYSRKFLKNNKRMNDLAGFVLLFGSWANILAVVPGGGRFITVVYMLIMVFVILYMIRYRGNMQVKTIRYLAVPLLIFYSIFTFRVGMDYMGWSTFFGNPFTALLIEDTTPIIDLVKSFL